MATPESDDVILFRHGIAEDAAERGVTDAERCLTEKGRKRTRTAARGLARWLGDEPVEIVSSPFERARETAAILTDSFETTPVELDTLAPGARPGDLLAQLRARPGQGTPIAVGHEPTLSACIAVAVGAETASGFDVKKAGACRLRLGEGGDHALEWLLPPRVLRQLAER